MKAAEQYFPMVLFIVLYKVILTFESVDEILNVSIQMKATEQYFPVVLFVFRYFTKSNSDIFSGEESQSVKMFNKAYVLVLFWHVCWTKAHVFCLFYF